VRYKFDSGNASNSALKMNIYFHLHTFIGYHQSLLVRKEAPLCIALHGSKNSENTINVSGSLQRSVKVYLQLRTDET